MSATATQPTKDTKRERAEKGEQSTKPPERRRKESIDYSRVLEAVKKAGFKDTLTDVIDVYMESEDEKAPFTAAKTHRTFGSFPYWLREGVKDNGENSLRLVVMALINVMAEEIRGDVWRLATGTSERAWVKTVDELHKHLDAKDDETSVEVGNNDKPSRFSPEAKKQRQQERASRSVRRSGSKSGKRGH
jgi:hypothetical protein